MQAKPDVHNDNAEAILDKFWSLQYIIPAGVISAFAGPVKTMHANNAHHSMTHAVHLRFGFLEVQLCDRAEHAMSTAATLQYAVNSQ